MPKNILIIHTGGTIGSYTDEKKKARVKSEESVSKASLYLVSEFFKENKNADITFENGNFPPSKTVLSEGMTLEKLEEIITFIKNKSIERFDGVIVLHGTDTLSYSSSLFSFAFCDIKTPLFLVSGNKPPMDKSSNAYINFLNAVMLIEKGIAPNVYVTYKNSDNISRLYLGNNILQSKNFSDDFLPSKKKFCFELNEKNLPSILEKAREISNKRNLSFIINTENLNGKVLLINPYTNLDYSLYEDAIKNKKVSAVVHSTYHSGTVSVTKENAQPSKYSFLYFAKMCKENNVPLVVAPTHLGLDQYETVNIVSEKTDAMLLNMTSESAYAKLVLALSSGFEDGKIKEYMQTNINGEKL